MTAFEAKIDKIYDDKLSDRISNEMFQRFYQKFSDEQSVLRKKIQELDNLDEKEIEMSLEKNHPVLRQSDSFKRQDLQTSCAQADAEIFKTK